MDAQGSEVNSGIKVTNINYTYMKDIITRAPDKMITFLQGSIILAYTNSLAYVDVSPYIFMHEATSPRHEDKNHAEVPIGNDQMQFFEPD